MSDITKQLHMIECGDPCACEKLVSLLYNELRKLAAGHLASERRDHSLGPTALVHEAYLRLVGNCHFEDGSHFYRAASQAMRRVLIDNARRRKCSKRGGKLIRKQFDPEFIPVSDRDEQLIALDEALNAFGMEHPRRAQLVELRYFGGMCLEEAAKVLEVSTSTAERDWKYARAWIYAAMKSQELIDSASSNPRLDG